MDSLSDAKQLSKGNKDNYLAKISLIDGLDPYSIPANQRNLSLDMLPRVTYNKMMEFLIFRLNPVSQAEVKSFKSLDAFIQFPSKWIESIHATKIIDCFVVFGKVLHSQKVSQPATSSWINLSADGDILACHCNCVAGLGESCTHVAAILFALEYAGKEAGAGDKSVTDVLAYWIGPKSKTAFYKKISEIDFSSAILKSKESSREGSPINPRRIIPELSETEMRQFLNEYQEEGCSSVLNRFFSAKERRLPKPLTNIYGEDYDNLSLEELQVVALAVDEMNVSQEQAHLVETNTRQQSKSSDWFLLRAGRITASKFKSACRTKVEKPSISLINNICYPHMYRATFKAGRYGCAHEKDAINAFLQQHQQMHPEARIETCGLYINPDFPHFAATPDGMLICKDCGGGCVEVKCPLCAADTSIEELIKKKKTCLVADQGSGSLTLSSDHAYFYQVQMQMAVTGEKACFFVVWSPQDFFVEKVPFDEGFWATQSAIATIFHQNVILPELLGKYFSRRARAEKASQSEASGSDAAIRTADNIPKLWCYCNKPDDGDEMVLCTAKNCAIKFFHKSCVLKETKKISKKWKCKNCKE